MPLYTFRCECGFYDEYLIEMSARDRTALFCEICGAQLKRMMDKPTLGKPAFQMKAVMADGSHVSGHFGKMARKK